MFGCHFSVNFSVKVVVLVGELIDNIQLVGLDVAFEHIDCGIAGDFHYVEEFHSGEVHHGSSRTQYGVGADDIVSLDCLFLADSASGCLYCHGICDVGDTGNLFDVSIDGLFFELRKVVVVFLKYGDEFFLAWDADLRAGLFLIDVDICNLLGADDRFGLS